MTARSHLAVVRSGAQTGVDVAALRAAVALELDTAGTMPLGFRTHDGPRPEYRERYGCTEDASPEWAPRTRANVAAADATLRLAEHQDSPGERCTANACTELGRPCFDVLLVRDERGLAPVAGDREKAIAGLRLLAVQLGRPLRLNVAGNSEKTSPGIEAAAERVLRGMLGRIAAPLRVYTGRVSYPGEDRLDISQGSAARAKSAGRLFPGLPWVPSWDILKPALAAREMAAKARLAGQRDEAAIVEAAAWELYVPAYQAQMRVSYGVHPSRLGPLEEAAVARGVKPNRGAWNRLLARERVTGLCFCVEEEGVPLRCHRRLWAEILAKLGAVDEGEVVAEASRGSQQTGLSFSGRGKC